MIDLRNAHHHGGTGAFHMQASRRQATRFVWMRVCERCLCRTTYIVAGVHHCAGCDFAVMFGSLEDAPPALGGQED